MERLPNFLTLSLKVVNYLLNSMFFLLSNLKQSVFGKGLSFYFVLGHLHPMGQSL